jgi:hypothetical protein
VATISVERTMGLLKVITISVNAIIIVSAPTATISVIIARTVGTIMIRGVHKVDVIEAKPAVNIPFAHKLRTCPIAGRSSLLSGRFTLSI